ncbi:MAG: hypothetical protein OEZ02_13905, partial [Anaerolineae bacterium]|nr:hypothetical protein [Anaerolineae bacterium]
NALLVMIIGVGLFMAVSSKPAAPELEPMLTATPFVELSTTIPVIQAGSQGTYAEIASLSWDFFLAPEQHDLPNSRWVVDYYKQAHAYPPNAVAFSPDGSLIATAERDIRFWQAQDGSPVLILAGHPKSIMDIAFTPDGQILASASQDKTVRLWRVADGSLLRSLDGHPGIVFGVAISPDGKTLAAATRDAVWVWDINSGELLRIDEHNQGYVYDIEYSPDGRWLGSVDKFLWLREASRGDLVFQTQKREQLSWRAHLAFAPNGEFLVENLAPEHPVMWRLNSHPDGSLDVTFEKEIFDRHSMLTSTFWGQADFVFSPDSTNLLILSGTPKILDVATDQFPELLQNWGGGNRGAAFSPDGSQIAYASLDGTLRVWQFVENVAKYLRTRPDPRYFTRAQVETIHYEFTIPEVPVMVGDNSIFSFSLDEAEGAAGFRLTPPQNLPEGHPLGFLKLIGAAYDADHSAVQWLYSSSHHGPPIYITQRHVNSANTILDRSNLPDVGLWAYVDSLDIQGYSAEYVKGGWILGLARSSYEAGGIYPAWVQISRNFHPFLTENFLERSWIFTNINFGDFPAGQKFGSELYWDSGDDNNWYQVLRWQAGDMLYEVLQVGYPMVVDHQFGGFVVNPWVFHYLERSELVEIADSMMDGITNR